MITASIVTYHQSVDEIKKLVNCLVDSIIDHIYIIDNSSNDILRVIEKDSLKIRYIHSKNIGFGKGHNIAIHEANKLNSIYHIIINPDIHLSGHIINELYQYMNTHLNVGIVMPQILYPNGDIQYLCKLLPTPLDLLIRRFIPLKFIQDKITERYELRNMDYSQEMEVPSLSGCFMFIRSSILIKIGGFDKRYFMYAEDLDLCRQISKYSKLIYYPKVYVYHAYEKGSYKNFKLLRYHIISIIKYFNKWGWFFDPERKKTNHTILQKLANKI